MPPERAKMLHLLTPTDSRWVQAASQDLAGLLSDHAHCELKAAHSALALVSKFGCDAPALIGPLSDLALEETDHFQQVCGQLEARGMPLTRTEADAYVRALWDATKVDRNRETVLLDRLLTSALIEARSCERFKLLSEGLDDSELATLYGALMESEARHHRLFCRLAEDLFGTGPARDRLAQLAEREADVCGRLPLGPRMHG